jgi:Flp pilus assembly protein TadG
MKLNHKSWMYRFLWDERGQTLPIMAILLVGFLATAALSMDLGRAYVGYRELQNATNAAALAGAEALPLTAPLRETTTPRTTWPA